MQLILSLLFGLIIHVSSQSLRDEDAARRWLQEYNTAAQVEYHESALASWAYQTNLTDYNEKRQLEASLKAAKFSKEAAHNVSLFAWRNFTDEDLKRQFHEISLLGAAALPSDKYEQLNNAISAMEKIYSTAEVCDHPFKTDASCFSLNPDIYKVYRESRSYEELLWVWQGWREETGRKMRDTYTEYVTLQNEAAHLNKYRDAGEYWQSGYEVEDFEAVVDRLYDEMKPLYQNLHAYVRRKLMEIYPQDKFPSSGHIPAHLLGNMWAQSWVQILEVLEPYKNKSEVDVTDAMNEQGYTVKKMFEVAEEFFVSLGLDRLSDSFWKNSVIEKPTDGTPMVCHASAWDMNNQADFRIKQCTEVNMGDLYVVHHELGHIYYYMEYKDHPIMYRGGANPGFHEAVGDLIALSVNTPEHLYKINLLDKVEEDTEADINFLISQALSQVAFLPFGLLVDKWRWGVFNGEITPANYNQKWWDLRCKLQGIYPPVPRSEEDFDPGAKFHVPADVPYIRYFISHVLMFQMHDALCKVAKNIRPLHRCDIYQSQEAGQKLSDMLSLGASRPWPEALEAMTGTRDINASAILTYYQPLLEWLVKQNEGHDITWEDQCPQGSFVDKSAAARLQQIEFIFLVIFPVLWMITILHA